MGQILSMIKKISIPYFSLIKKAFLLTWQKKYLWFFGLFAMSIGFFNFNVFNFDFQKNETINQGIISNEEVFKELLEKLQDHLAVVILILAGFFILGLVILFLHIIAKIALIDAGLKEEKIEGALKEISALQGINNGFKIGIKYFWKIVGLDFIFFLFSLVLLPILFLLYLIFKTIPLFSVLNIILFPLFVFLVFLFLILIYNYSLRIIINQEAKIFASIKKSFYLIREFWSSCFMAWLISLVLKILQGMGLIISVFLIAIPFGILAFILFLLFQKIGLIIGIILGGIGVFCAIIIWQGISGSVYSLYWTFVCQKLQKNQETKGIKKP